MGSIPAGILGLLFEEKLKTLFASPEIVSVFLILNVVLLYGAEKMRKRKPAPTANHDDAEIAQMSWSQVVQIGGAQCLALIPGFSRTGSTIAGGLFVGLHHENAARFSFLLATPIILAASVLKLPELLVTGTPNVIGPILVGSISAGIAAYFSVKFLTKYFKTKKLTPFALYCMVVGVITSLVFLVG